MPKQRVEYKNKNKKQRQKTYLNIITYIVDMNSNISTANLNMI